jgi:hypothetical protein
VAEATAQRHKVEIFKKWQRQQAQRHKVEIFKKWQRERAQRHKVIIKVATKAQSIY